MQETKGRDPLIGEVKAGLARHDLTHGDLATHLKLSRTAIGRRLNGEVPFDINELRLTAELIKIPIADLIATSALAEGGDAA